MHTLRLIIISFIALSFVACGQVEEDPEETPEDLGTIFTGGKADEPSQEISVSLAPEKEKVVRFTARGDFDIFWRPSDHGGWSSPAFLIDVRDVREGSTAIIRQLGPLGESMELHASDSPFVTVRNEENPDAMQHFEVKMTNPNEEDFAGGDLVFSKPVETECFGLREPDAVLEPVARCQVVVEDQLEDESKKVVQWADLCIALGKFQDDEDPEVWHDAIRVRGEYSYYNENHREDYTSKVDESRTIKEQSADSVTMEYEAWHEVTEYSYGLFGRDDGRRHWRRFRYEFDYDPEANELQWKVRSRTQMWPNWFWELGARATCEAR